MGFDRYFMGIEKRTKQSTVVKHGWQISGKIITRWRDFPASHVTAGEYIRGRFWDQKLAFSK
jgi:hypothetical protein